MFKLIVYTALLAAAVVGVAYLANEANTLREELNERPGRRSHRAMYSAYGGTKEEYIANLKRTEKDNDERARRIKAVENMKQWP